MTLPRSRALSVLAAGVISSALACKEAARIEEPELPQSGYLYVNIRTPNTNDGAVYVRVVGPEIANPENTGRYALYHRKREGKLEAVIVGEIVSGDLLKFFVADARQPYAVELVEVANRDNQLRSPLVGYSVSLRGP